ncbi:MAG: glycosyl hydrolase [Chitinophagales bacterium]|nr:glycosyl hydrolase [Chitinophagales bacterium]
MRKIFFSLLSAFLVVVLCRDTFAQKNAASPQPPFTKAAQRLTGFEQRKNLEASSLLSQIQFRNVGPTIMSGRVVDVDVNPNDATEFYVAYASGGLWYTHNNGLSFQPIFDQEAVMTIGDIAVKWSNKNSSDQNIIWVGTGENNSSRSSYSGFGIFKSVDGGKTWINSGLPESHHIGRIVLDPDDADIVFVAVLGHLYSTNKERGIYKTSDGGKTWKQKLFVDDTTGCIDLILDPVNKNILYAAAWDRIRHPWNFQGSGIGSGIYKSTDHGETWSLVTTGTNGFPKGTDIGRIGLAAANNQGKTVLYAVVDNQFAREKKVEDSTALTKGMLRTMSSDKFLSLKKKRVEDFLRSNSFPDKYTADTIFTLMQSRKISPQTLVQFLEDANALLFETEIIGAELYRSDDGGASWQRTHSYHLDDLFYTYGYYFSQLRVEKNNPNNLYIVGYVVLKSNDGGKTFQNILKENVHVDNHALWVDPNRPGHLVLGNDGGVNVTFDDGKNWLKCNNPSVGQFYSVNYDMDHPYNVFGGLQDNGVWYGPSTTENTIDWHQTGQYPYKEILGGDGMDIAVDQRGNSVVYTGFQFGNYFRVNVLTQSTKDITPKHELSERPYRWNWESPIQISTYNEDILYFGCNKLMRSFNRGDNFKPISPDLTKGGKKGNVPYGTITTLNESTLKFGLIYTGSDDGLIYVTKDGGNSWTKISDKLPQDLWVSRIQASQFSESRVYASLNGYRWDDFNSYLYVSENYGASWTRLGTDLPAEPINVVREDPVNENILFVGTDHGVYVSIDRGKKFMRMSGGLPAVSVHDLVIQPREHDLILGTHGRSIYVASIQELEMLRDSILSKPLYAFSISSTRYSNNWGKKDFTWDSIKGPEVKIPIYLNRPGNVKITIYADSNLLLSQLNYEGKKGLNYIKYDLSIDSTRRQDYEGQLNKNLKADEEKIAVKKADNGRYYLHPGEYKCVIETSGYKAEKKLVIEKPHYGSSTAPFPENPSDR